MFNELLRPIFLLHASQLNFSKLVLNDTEKVDKNYTEERL